MLKFKAACTQKTATKILRETTGNRLCVCSVSSVRRLPDTKMLKYTNTDFYIFSKRKNKKTICSGKQTTTKKLLYVTNSPIGLPCF